MTFPFLWIGAFVAAAFLSVVLALFGLALRALTRTTSEVRGSILPGLVSGFRDWAAESRSGGRRIVSPGGPDSPGEVDDGAPGQAPPLEPLHPHLR